MSKKLYINNQQVKRLFLSDTSKQNRVKKIYINDELIFTASVTINIVIGNKITAVTYTIYEADGSIAKDENGNNIENKTTNVSSKIEVPYDGKVTFSATPDSWTTGSFRYDTACSYKHYYVWDNYDENSPNTNPRQKTVTQDETFTFTASYTTVAVAQYYPVTINPDNSVETFVVSVTDSYGASSNDYHVKDNTYYLRWGHNLHIIANPSNTTKYAITYHEVKNVRGTVNKPISCALNTYTVTFLDFEGNVFATQYVDYGEYATAPTSNPEKYGCDFEGWNATVGGIGAINTLQIHNDVTFAPTYSYHKFTGTGRVVGGNPEGTVLEVNLSEISPTPARILSAKCNGVVDGYGYNDFKLPRNVDTSQLSRFYIEFVDNTNAVAGTKVTVDYWIFSI